MTIIDARRATRDLRVTALTPRECDVLDALARGLSNAAIARELFLSERTVDCHVAAIFRALDLAASTDTNRRVRAAVWWLSGEIAQSWRT